MMILNIKQKNKILNALIGLFIVLILIFSILLFIVFKEGVKCSQNPLVYGVSQFKNPAVYCTCYSKNPSYNGFVVDSEGITALGLGNEGSLSVPNFSIKSS